MTQSHEVAPLDGAGFGSRLQAARRAAGLSREDVSRRLKMPVRVIDALESDAPCDPGAAVFVRGQLRSYARLLGLEVPAHVIDAKLPPVAAPELVSHTFTPRYRHLAEQMGRRALYIVLTAAIVAPVWLATRTGGAPTAAVESLELPANLPVTAAPDADGVVAVRTPLVASMASLPAPPPKTGLDLTLRASSWVEVFAPDGRVLERATLDAGERRHYDAHQVGRVVLGNASAAVLRKNGETVDLGPFQRANVARFALSSDGSLVPVVD